MSAIHSTAVVIESPKELKLSRLVLDEPKPDDIVVEIEWSGISTGTEKLLWNGTMPHFPGMGYPLVPGYESVGRVIEVGAKANIAVGQRVFVPGAKCFGDVKGLFGGAASHVVVPSGRVTPLSEQIGREGVLLALAATAYHVTQGNVHKQPDLIIGHGVVGRLIARIAVMLGHQPVVWEVNADRMSGAKGYQVIHPDSDAKKDYARICDASGQARVLNQLISRLKRGGEIILAGFYDNDIAFQFAPAFMREAKLRIASQWDPSDLSAVKNCIDAGLLSLDDLITHSSSLTKIDDVYRTAFEDARCLKMIVDWRSAK
jgi:3-hydroxyethyl bacteriochlorophyllide a dehydrogenase